MNPEDDAKVNPYEPPAESPTEGATTNEAIVDFPIVLEGDLTVDDYLAAWRLAMWTSAGLWFRYAARSMFVVFGATLLIRAWRSSQFGDWNQVGFEAVVGLTLLACVTWTFIAIRWSVKRHLQSMDAKLGDSPLVVDKVGVHMNGTTLSADYKWEGFEGYRTNGSVLVLYINYPRQYLGIFEKHAASPRHWQFLKRFISERLTSC